jgi:cytochrome c oxidase assembly protein subunit 16
MGVGNQDVVSHHHFDLPLLLTHTQPYREYRANNQRLNNPSYAASSSDSKLSATPLNPSSIPEGTPKPPTTKRKFSMQALNNDEYEPVRVPRPEGVPEWGGGVGGEDAPVKGQRKTDRWV